MIEGQYLETPETKRTVVDFTQAKAYTPQQWRNRLSTWIEGERKVWPAHYGPWPGCPGCLVPPDILAEFSVTEADCPGSMESV